jgi:peptidoglycan/LPS O-acetylase OafA/YrhL
MRPGAARIAGLDVLRGFAAAAVMLHHHAQYYDVLYPGRIPLSVDLGPGHFGVELFFIISGFVILMTIERKKTVREFAISRTARLMPAFLAALLMATVIRIVSPVPFLDTPTVPQFLANLTMASSLFGQTPMDMPYWTLTYELVFYIGMGLILALGMLRWTEWFGLLAVAVSCLFIATLDVRLHHRSSIVLLVYYSNFFLIGICLYRIYARSARLITYVALVCAIAVTVRGGGEQAFYASGYLYLPITAAFAIVVWFAASKHGKWLASPPMVFLGRISYPLYLVHVVLGYSILRFGVEQGWSTLGGVIAAAIASVIVATLLHYLVEVPGERWSRTLLMRKKPLTPAILAPLAEPAEQRRPPCP